MPQPGGTYRLHVVVRCLGLATAFGGLLSFLGWILNAERLTDWFATGITIKVNAALALFCAGIGLALLPTGKKVQWAVQLLGGFVSLLGGLTLVQHVLGVNLAIDELLM